MAATEISARTAELAATSAHASKQDVVLQQATSELGITQQRLSQVQVESTQRVNQAQVEARERVMTAEQRVNQAHVEARERLLTAEQNAASVGSTYQRELMKLRGELAAASSAAGVQLDVARTAGESSTRMNAQLENLLKESVVAQQKQAEELMSMRREMHRMQATHEAEKRDLENRAVQQLHAIGEEMKAQQQQLAMASASGSGDRGNGLPITVEQIQQIVAQQVAAQAGVMLRSGAAPPPPPPPQGSGTCNPPGLGGPGDGARGPQSAFMCGAGPPPPPPPGGGGTHVTFGHGQQEGQGLWHAGMAVQTQGGPPNGDPEGSPEDDSESDMARAPRSDGRRREATKAELPELPAAAGFRTWKTNAYREICGCSSDPQRAFTWLSEIDGEADDEMINVIKERWKSLDGKIAAALGKIMKGPLLRRVNTKIESLAKMGRFAAGRLVLRWLVQDFAVDNSRGALYDISDLMQLKLTGTSAGAIQSFLEAWTWVEQGLKSDVATRVKEAMLWHQLKDCRILEPELVLYRTAPEGSQWRNYEYLLRSVESYVKRNRQDATRDEVLKGIQHLGGGAGQAYPAQEQSDACVVNKRDDKKKSCWAWEKGECKRGTDCKFAHEAQKKGVRKGSRSVTPTRSPTAGGKPICLAWSKTGQCSYGDRCKYSHDAPASAEYDKQHASRVDPPDLTPCCVGEMFGSYTCECTHTEVEHVTSSVEESHCLACREHDTQRRWICDSGAGVDLIGRSHVWMSEQESVRRDMREKRLRTANGVTTADSSVVCEIGQINTCLNPLILDECPPVISLGKRVAQGFKFVWSEHECALFTPNGDKVVLQVENHVPVLVQEVNSHLTASVEWLKHEGDACPGEDITEGPESSEPDGHDEASAPSGAMEGEEEAEEEEDAEELPSRMQYMKAGKVRDAAKTKIHKLSHFPRNRHCECCNMTRFQNKQARRIPSGESAVRVKHFGDMLHLDHVFTNGDFLGCHGERCALIVVDEATRFCHMYPAKEKSAENVISALRHFIGTDVEWQRICVKSDNAFEYAKACKDLGIAWFESTPNRHESNGLVERLIRTISDITRSILHQSGLGHPFWSVAGPTATMMMNVFVPNEDGKFPWQSRRGGLFPHLACAFGARVRCIIPGKMADKRPKFTSRGAPCLFAGWHWAPGFVHSDYQVINEEQLKVVEEASAVHVHRVADVMLEECFVFPLGGRNLLEDPKALEGEGGEKEGGIDDLLTRQQSEAGWRIDRFGSRIVKVPPHSTRPSAFDPESWQGLPYSVRRAIGKKSERPSEARASTDTMLTVPLPLKRVSFESEASGAGKGETFNIGEIDDAWMEQHREAQIFVEVCCDKSSVFGRRCVDRVCVIRVTEEDDLCELAVQEFLKRYVG
eukprot:6472816-Amphidinium_carterae.2